MDYETSNAISAEIRLQFDCLGCVYSNDMVDLITERVIKTTEFLTGLSVTGAVHKVFKDCGFISSDRSYKIAQ